MYPSEENGYCVKWEYMEQFCLFEIFICCSASGREAERHRISVLSAVLVSSLSPSLIGIAYCSSITVYTVMYDFTGWMREKRWGKWNVNSMFCSMLGCKIQLISMALFHCPVPWQAALLQIGRAVRAWSKSEQRSAFTVWWKPPSLLYLPQEQGAGRLGTY